MTAIELPPSDNVRRALFRGLDPKHLERARFTIHLTDGLISNSNFEFWSYVFESAGPSDQWPVKDLCKALKWIVQQINFGNFKFEEDEGEVVSVLMGRGVPFEAGEMPATKVAERVQKLTEERLLSVNLADVFARSREQGTEPQYKPEHERMAEIVNSGKGDGALFNTELSYIFQFIDILKRIRERSFILDAPPIMGKAATGVVDLLGEATRCHLYGFHRACVAICRACMEKALKDTIPGPKLRLAKWKPKEGHLQRLMRVARTLDLLDVSHFEMANQVRKEGNEVLHRDLQKLREESWEILVKTRGVISHLYRDGGQ